MSSHAALAEASAGAASSLVTAVVLAPVDTAKTNIQAGLSQRGTLGTCRTLVEADGIGGLYRGTGPKALQAVLQNFIYFYVYASLKALRAAAGFPASTTSNTLLGVCAGVCNLTVTLPLETCVVQRQVASGAGGSLFETMQQLVAQGPSGIWRGMGVSSVLTLNPALTFAIFDALKAKALKMAAARSSGERGSRSLSSLQAFLLGALSKALATVVTYPLIRTKVVMQARRRKEEASATVNGPTSPTHFSEVLVSILRESGISGLYRGCDAQIFSAVTKSGIQLMSKEQLLRYILATLALLSRTSSQGKRRLR